MDISTGNFQIECLQGQQVFSTRPLWEKVFSEDSPAFTNYYFDNKAGANTAFICRCLPTGEIVSMVHLTPCEMLIEDRSVSTFYIVGVATDNSYRHKGLMSSLLEKSFDYAARLQCPFVFLMPADPAIYEPFGFSYIYSRFQYNVPEILNSKEVYINSFSCTDIRIQYLEKETSLQMLETLVGFAQKTLSYGYDYYLKRTPSYYRTLLLELYAQNGCIYTVTLNNCLEGYFLYAKEEKSPFIQELLFSDKLYSYINSKNYVNLFPTPQPDKKPIIMAKNLCSVLLDCPESQPGSHSVSSVKESLSFPACNHDYVNYMAAHKGFINEIV